MKKSDKTVIDKFAVVDLFCGIGGLTHGLIKEGFKVAAGVDFDESCKFAFESNNRSRFIHDDVTKLEPEDLTLLFPPAKRKILVGCAPCQPFSTYNSKIKQKDYLSTDSKWKLLYSFAELIRKTQPDIVSMENVPTLQGFKNGKVLRDFISYLEKEDYKVTKYIVYCPNYGIPQRRRRLILFASKFGEIELIEKTHQPPNYKTVRQTIGDLPALEDGEISESDSLHRARKLNALNKRRIRATKEGGGWKDWDEKLVLACHKKDSGKSYGSVYGRMKWDDVAPTMTTLCSGLGNGRFGHPDQHRAISLREAALFQTFPKSYKLIDPNMQFSGSKVARHIGNAVPVDLGRVIAKSIKNHLIKINS